MKRHQYALNIKAVKDHKIHIWHTQLDEYTNMFLLYASMYRGIFTPAGITDKFEATIHGPTTHKYTIQYNVSLCIDQYFGRPVKMIYVPVQVAWASILMVEDRLNDN